MKTSSHAAADRPPFGNVLFIMCDQLRADYLSCYGHPSPAYAEHRRPGGSRRALRRAPTCRARYAAPRACRPTPGDTSHARSDLELRAAVGRPEDPWRSSAAARRSLRTRRQDARGARPRGREAARHRHHARRQAASRWKAGSSRTRATTASGRRASRSRATPTATGCARAATCRTTRGTTSRTRAAGADGEILSGWQMRWADCPRAIDERHSETPYTTDRAIDFMRRGRRHAVGPAPVVHQAALALRRPGAVPRFVRAGRRAARRAQRSRAPPRRIRSLEAIRRDAASAASAATRCAHGDPDLHGPDQAGRRPTRRAFSRSCASAGLDRDTLVVFTSDHGDYLGDHWLGEKELFHDPSCACR